MRGEERATVKTYVPAYQKREWADHADDLGMSQSEYMRTMVQAGRRNFEIPSGEPMANGSGQPSQGPVTDVEDLVLDILRSRDSLGWDDVVAGITGDIEEEVSEVLTDLQEGNRVLYDGRKDAYILKEDG